MSPAVDAALADHCIRCCISSPPSLCSPPLLRHIPLCFGAPDGVLHPVSAVSFLNPAVSAVAQTSENHLPIVLRFFAAFAEMCAIEDPASVMNGVSVASPVCIAGAQILFKPTGWPNHVLISLEKACNCFEAGHSWVRLRSLRRCRQQRRR